MGYQARSDLYEVALELATKAHAGQTDKGGASYIEHPKRVASKFKDQRRKIVAVLHDVIEDTSVTIEEIESLFGKDIALDILALTKQDGEDYMSFVKRAAARPVSKDVKIEDIRDNSRIERLSEITQKDRDRFKKYEQALELLLAPSEEL